MLARCVNDNLISVFPGQYFFSYEQTIFHFQVWHLGVCSWPSMSETRKEKINALIHLECIWSLREFAVTVSFYLITGWLYLHKTVKWFPYRLQTEQQPSVANKQNDDGLLIFVRNRKDVSWHSWEYSILKLVRLFSWSGGVVLLWTCITAEPGKRNVRIRPMSHDRKLKPTWCGAPCVKARL